MKILKYILKITIWAVIAVYLLTILTFSIPSIQQYTGERIAVAIGDKLGTNVKIGSVNPGWLNRLVVDKISMDDQSGKQLLVANRMSVRINLISLITSGKIDISTAQIFGGKISLYQNRPEDKPNFQFVLDSLASKESKSDSKLDLRLGSLIMRRTSVSYDKNWIARRYGQFDVNHIKVTDLSSHILIKTLTNDSLNVIAKNISMKEQGGLDVKRLAFQLECGRNRCKLKSLDLKLPDTQLALGEMEADYRIKGKKIDLEALRYHGEIKPSHIALSDLSAFVPSLKQFKGTISFRSKFKGEKDDLDIEQLLVESTSGDIDIDCNGWVKNITEKNQWLAHVNNLSLSAQTIGFISENLKGTRFTPPAPLVRMGDIQMHGLATGTALDVIKVQQQIRTDVGSLKLNFDKEADQSFQADIKTESINLQQLLDDAHFGQVSADIAVNGSLDRQHFLVHAKGNIGQFIYNEYPFRNIKIDARYDSKEVGGNLSIDDPNIGLDISGLCQMNHNERNIQIKASILNFSPKAINLSDKWGDARFFADISSDIRGSRIDNSTGSVKIDNFSMLSSTDSYEFDQLHIMTGYEGDTHFMRLRSDFAQAEIMGKFDYKTLTKSFTDFLANQLPTLPGLPRNGQGTKFDYSQSNGNTTAYKNKRQSAANNDFSVHLHITRGDWLQRLLKVPLAIRKPVTIDGFVNDNTHTINLKGSAAEFYFNGNCYRDAYANIHTPGDTLVCQLGVAKMMDNDDRIDLKLQADAHHNQLNTSLHWNNHKVEKNMEGTLNATTIFHKTENGQHAANVQINPSRINIHNTWWNVEPSSIYYAPKHVSIKNFTIKHDSQHLVIDGTASPSEDDGIVVNLNDIDIEYILELVNFHAVDFNGHATGQVLAHAIFSKKPKASAQLAVDGFEFEHGRMGTLNANVVWNEQDQQIDIHAIADDGQISNGRDSKTYIEGYVSPVKSFIDLGIRAENTRIEFMHSFTKSFISHIDGSALGAVRLFGPLSTINIEGQLVVNGEAHVKPTGCTYYLKNDTINLVPDEISFASCYIYDKNNQRGLMTGGIHHKHLTNLTYDLYVDANHLLAYDFNDFRDDTFYGTVYSTGRVGIHGRPNETTIDLNITPEKGSSFTYNVAQPDAIGNQEFISWVTHRDNDTKLNQTSQEVTTDNPLEDRSDMRINFLINCTPNATLRLLMDNQTNDYITLNGNGILRATWFNKGGFQMFGTYHVEHGTYGVTIQEIIKKDFTFQPGGTIVFAGDPYEATLNLQALHAVNGVSLSDLNVGKSFSNTVKVNCLMNITGQPSNPIVDFDLDMPNVNTDEKQMVRSIINGQEEMNQQVLYLLGFGRFYPQGANNAEAGETQQNQTSLAMQGLLSGTLSSQINTLLKSVIKSNDWSFGANISTGDEGWNNAEYEGIVSGRMFNNRLLLNGQFGYRDKANTANTTFIGDFDVRYLLVPNGNLALKVYNQTNDRYFTKSSLNTQGLGLIIKKDFSNLRDLFGIRKKKATKAKKEKKEKKQ